MDTQAIKKNIFQLCRTVGVGFLIYLCSPAWIWVLMMTFKILGSLLSVVLAIVLIILVLFGVAITLRAVRREQSQEHTAEKKVKT